MDAAFGPEIGKSALVIVDMQNDFVHPDGGFGHIAREMTNLLPSKVSTLSSRKVSADSQTHPWTRSCATWE
jgi:nicotinamidase-related amidase